MVDLGKWLDGAYRIPTEPNQPEEEDDSPQAQEPDDEN
jgi:endogenous inhibitor of DNA gyrase (YacG/DUF329 family)